MISRGSDEGFTKFRRPGVSARDEMDHSSPHSGTMVQRPAVILAYQGPVPEKAELSGSTAEGVYTLRQSGPRKA